MKCPSLKTKCPESNDSKKGCPWWTVLTVNGGEQTGRCAISWFPILLIENRIAVENLRMDDKKITSVSVKRKNKR